MLSCLKPLWQCLTLSLPAGVRMGSLGLFLQCVTSIFFSTIMDRMVKQFGTRAVYLTSVVFFPAAAFVMCLSHSVIVVTISAALTGFTFSALQILPYTLASLYHHEKQVGICSGAARMVWTEVLFLHLLSPGCVLSADSHDTEKRAQHLLPEASPAHNKALGNVKNWGGRRVGERSE